MIHHSWKRKLAGVAVLLAGTMFAGTCQVQPTLLEFGGDDGFSAGFLIELPGGTIINFSPDLIRIELPPTADA